MNKFTCSKFILVLFEGTSMLEKTLKKTIYTKSNYFPGNFVCILLQILYFYLTTSFLPSATAVLEVEEVRCSNLWCPNIFTVNTECICLCTYLNDPPVWIKLQVDLIRVHLGLLHVKCVGVLGFVFCFLGVFWLVGVSLARPVCQVLVAGFLQPGGRDGLMWHCRGHLQSLVIQFMSIQEPYSARWISWRMGKSSLLYDLE